MILIAFYLVLIIAELAIMRYVKNKSIPWKDIISNMNSGHILLWVFRSLIITAYLYIYQNFSLHLLAKWPHALKLVFTLFAWDLCFYWSHRLHHHVKLLWAVHTVHHDSEHFNLSLGIRNSWYSSLTSFPFFSILAFAGIPLEIFIAVSAIHYFIQFYNHNNLVKKSGWLEYILITPSHHRVHHGKNDLYVNKNFGGTFVFWDKLFNTFQEERRDMPVDFGINEPLHSENPFVMSNRPFFKSAAVFNRLKLDATLKFKFPVYMVVIGSLLLFILMLNFMYLEKTIQGTEKLFLFFIIFLGTIGNAGLSEGRKWSVPVWIFTTISMTVFFIVSYHISNPALLIPLLMFAGHGIFIAFFSIKSHMKKAPFMVAREANTVKAEYTAEMIAKR